MKVSAGIYIITNLGNNIDKGKCYIGLSKNIEKRKQQHYHNSTTIKGKNNKKLYWAMDTFGKDNFNFDVLEYCDVSLLGEKEIYYIKKYNSFYKGYNSSDGGEGVSKNDLVDRFNLIDNFNLNLIDNQDYSNPNIVNEKIENLNQVIIKNNQIFIIKKDKLDFKKDKYNQKKKTKKVTKINLKLDLLKEKFNQQLEQLENEKKTNFQIIRLIKRETKLKNRYSASINDYIKTPFEELREKAFNYSIEKRFFIQGPSYDVNNFQKNNQKYQKIEHYSNVGNLNIYSKYLSYKPNERSPIKLLFAEIEEISFVIYEECIHINFNGWSQLKWNQISRTYQSGNFYRPDSFYLIFSNNEFDKLIEVILSVRRELRI